MNSDATWRALGVRRLERCVVAALVMLLGVSFAASYGALAWRLFRGLAAALTIAS